MSLEITIRHVRALAGKRGYHVIVEDSHIHVIKKCDEQIRRSFDLHDPFRIDPPCTQQFTFLCIYYWIRGYHISSEEKAMVRIEPARHHPEWNLRQPREKQLAYQGLFHLHVEIAIWVQYLETHHCPFMDMFPTEDAVQHTSLEHILA
jgi:hypothetical protein